MNYIRQNNKMRIVKKYETFQVKTNEINYLFGAKNLHRHKMRDKRWTAADKMIQYSGLAKLYERDHALRVTTEKSNLKKRQAMIKDIEKEIRNKDKLLHDTIKHDDQRIKNLFQDDVSLKRAFAGRDISTIIEKVSEKTFRKRGQLDSLKHKQQKLTDHYEKRLFEVAKLQDSIKYHELFEPKEKSLIKVYQAYLKDSQTRTRTLMTINRSYKKIIDVMLQDSIYYDNLLNALKADMEEQESFIQTTIHLGKPTIQNAAKLQNEYENLETKTRKEINMRIKDMLKYREIISNNNEKVKMLVRRDDDFEIDPTRYDRDTATIKTLKSELERVEESIRSLKLATAACDPMDIYPNMKIQSQKRETMLEGITRKENEKELAIEKEQHAKSIEETLKYELTDDEIDKLRDIDAIKLQISQERQKQDVLNEKIKSRNENFILIRKAFKHLGHVLKNVGNGSGSSESIQFKKAFQLDQAFPSSEENIDELLTEAQTKIDALAKMYQTVKEQEGNKEEDFNSSKKDLKVKIDSKQNLLELDDKNIQKWKDYHDAIIKELSGFQISGAEDNEKVDTIDIEEMMLDDPSILTRHQIKAMSANIVNKNIKQDY